MTKLTQDELKTLLIYDPNSGVFKWKVTRNQMLIGSVAGHKNRSGYVEIKVKGKNYLSHRLAWLYMTGGFPKLNIDHLNGIKNDNRILNLRDVSHSENAQNQRKSNLDNQTNLLGVTFYKTRNSYKAQIVLNKKNIFLGYFKTSNEAHQAYLTEKRKIHSACTI